MASFILLPDDRLIAKKPDEVLEDEAYGSLSDTNASTPDEEVCEHSDYSTVTRFGHGPDAWIYRHDVQRFDLSRGSHSKLIIDTDPNLRFHRGVIIDPTRTILVVVDMQNYFVHPDCTKHDQGLAAVGPLLSVMQRCREEAIQIAFLNWVIDEHDLVVMPPGVQRAFYQRRAKTHGSPWFTALGAQLPGDMGRCLWRDSWNAALYAPLKEAQQPEDVIFHKNRPSGMWSLDQDMHRYLRQHDKKTVIFAGVNTDQCVLGTLTDAYSNGFDCILLGDCTGTQSGFQANELCDWNVATMYGFVTDSASFVSSVRETD